MPSPTCSPSPTMPSVAFTRGSRGEPVLQVLAEKAGPSAKKLTRADLLYHLREIAGLLLEIEK